MRVTIESFRALLIGAAALLVVVVAGFLAVAHVRSRRLLHDLPAKLGADIQRETSSFTYSQAVQGRTVFTIHAARAIQRVGGKVTLHDVGIVLYAQGQARADRIYGEQFEYDQASGIVTAAGVVHLDLAAPAPADAQARRAYAAGEDHPSQHADEHDPEIIHVRTSGLLYEQKTGVVSTDQQVDFTLRGVSGHARGARYDTRLNRMLLEHEVRLSGVRNDRPMLLTAADAAMDRAQHLLLLHDARYVDVGESANGANAREEASGRVVRVLLGDEGRPERVEASGGVTLANDRGIVRAAQASVLLRADGRPATAQLEGGLEYTRAQPLQETMARATSAAFTFDEAGVARRLRLNGNAHVAAKARAVAGAPWRTERNLTSEHLDFSFITHGGSRSELHDAVAVGNARMGLTSLGASSTASEQTEISAQQITARFSAAGGAPALARLEGSGGTALQVHRADGSEERSTGDTFAADFRTDPHGQKSPSVRAAERQAMSSLQIEKAVQRGEVRIQQTGKEKDGQRETVEGRAGEMVFDGGDRLALNGGARLTRQNGTLEANRIELRRSTGEVNASGAVQASFAGAGSGNLIHVQAQRAEFLKDRSEATFHGEGTEQVRAWQGGSQIQAPALVLRQKTGDLEAFGRPDAAAQVRTVLDTAVRAGVKANASQPQERGAVRITSSRMSYSAAGAQAAFTGGVVLQQGQATLRSPEVIAFLRRVPGTGKTATQQPESQGKRAPAVFPENGLDRMEARGGVVLQEPGREATGDQLVYTAADEKYVLTGRPSSVMDAAKGTVRGNLIQFFSNNQSVIVSGDVPQGTPGRVRSEVKVKSSN